MEAGLSGSEVRVTLVDEESYTKPSLFFELGAAIGMGKRILPILPRSLNRGILPPDLRLRSYLVRDTPEHTAEEMANGLQAA